jgi:hypothetical protein
MNSSDESKNWFVIPGQLQGNRSLAFGLVGNAWICSRPESEKTTVLILRMIMSRRLRLAGHVAQMGRRGMHIGYWWKAKRKGPLGRPRRRFVDNIKMNIGERGYHPYGLDLSGSEQIPVDGSCEHGNQPSGSITFWKILE